VAELHHRSISVVDRESAWDPGAALSFCGGITLVSAPNEWRFADHFTPLHPGKFAREVRSVSKLADESGIENHAFFDLAALDRRALEFWSAQEAVTTNAFSQLLLLCCAHLPNVHARATFLPVIAGEHHELRSGIASRSHPWLLKRLCESLQVDVRRISPAPCTLLFIKALADCVVDPLSGLGALGVGNERMLVPEYTAVESAFRTCIPTADFSGFLNSNINEDVGHSALLEALGTYLVGSATDLEKYTKGARIGVNARLHYYDHLRDLFMSGVADKYM
jgi:hypothetical protein